MSSLYLLRHGETEWNVAGRRQGHLDSPLTARGQQQGREVGSRLRELIEPDDVSLFASSPLGRAHHTARLVASELGLSPDAIREDPRLAEHHMGAWQGLTNAEVEERFPGALSKRRGSPWIFAAPGGESYAQLHERAVAWLTEVAAAPLVVAVAHAGIGRVLMGAFCGSSQDETLGRQPRHGAIYRLRDGRIEEI
jgi:probable phosphoglycerate mutase